MKKYLFLLFLVPMLWACDSEKNHYKNLIIGDWKRDTRSIDYGYYPPSTEYDTLSFDNNGKYRAKIKLESWDEDAITPLIHESWDYHLCHDNEYIKLYLKDTPTLSKYYKIIQLDKDNLTCQEYYNKDLENPTDSPMTFTRIR